MESITVLGIDQGLANIGYCVMKVHKELIDEPIILESNTFTTSSDLSTPDRLGDIYDKVEDIFNRHPDISYLGCERLFFSGARSATILNTNLVTGVLFLFTHDKGIKIKDYPATSVKKIMTGDGKAKKEDIAKAIIHICEINNIADKERTDHEDDSIAIAYTTAKDVFLNVSDNINKHCSKTVHKAALVASEKAETVAERTGKFAFKDELKNIPLNYGIALNDYTKRPIQGMLKVVKSTSKKYLSWYNLDFNVIYMVNEKYADYKYATDIEEMKSQNDFIKIDETNIKKKQITKIELEDKEILLIKDKTVIYVIRSEKSNEENVDKFTELLTSKK